MSRQLLTIEDTGQAAPCLAKLCRLRRFLFLLDAPSSQGAPAQLTTQDLGSALEAGLFVRF